ncbi:MAG: hypothetical protein A3A97_03925 [Candidatus Terrybacteria bacterium RIFCSPLOWO2_01_FULL_40_23]|uniref:Uncharacterized protein n=1 Tax=Candidatus Terrybacteria bacterium RIFCSPLOWO2_01_FULL_40_23 TaxID=1802366 RepID=A0A1G2PW21_9BACT|nr:MAG: hypothetical protein A3A97_03925 [Candidatus Terrybacteria bacterium RIFCSPLOWO2_01_FULL_40_23]
MIPIEDFRKSLGETGRMLPQREIEGLLRLHYQIADVLFDLWIRKTAKTVVSAQIQIHKQDGNIIEVFNFGFIYVS